MDILFINPPSPDNSIIIRDFNRSGRTSKERIIWPQTSLAYLAAMTPENLKIEILDCIAEKINWDKFLKILNIKKPRYVVSHVITSTARNDLRVFEEAKKIGAITITMGPHVTELPEKTLRENLDLDFVIVGEPEITFRELIKNLETKIHDFGKIKGLAYRIQEKIKINERREFLANLDELPIPRHDLLPLNKYVFPFMASKFTFVLSERGCPFPCTFCRQPIMWERKIRHRSPESIIKELKILKEIGLKEFIFHSDTFTIDKDIVMKLCQMMINENFNFRWACNSRVDTVDEEMLKLMKKAGCWMIAYGIESGSPEILKKCEKEATVEQAEKTVKLTHENGIKVYGYFIIGLLGETQKTIQETIEFSKKLPITFAIFHIASPYPGTKFYQQVKEKGWLVSEKWENIDQGRNAPIHYPQLSGKEIMAGTKKAYRSFYLRPKVILNILCSIRNFGDLEALFRAGIAQLF
ncbi:MAG: B12-binding domain-containing radical SAM protein [Patescibacteria group bacterium]|nr:B12-binding domain-containing radical SAM protein [Patescibacteria group bacterium]